VHVAAIAIVLGIAVNTVVKSSLAFGLGGAALGKRVGLTGLLVLIAAGASIVSIALL